MGSEHRDATATEAPLPQRLLERPWLLAAAAIVFFTLSYVVWGLIDILGVAAG